MDRAEAARQLAEVFRAEGYSDRWRTLMDSIREHGPLHEEWSTCKDCGGEFEPEPMSINGTRLTTRCPTCAAAEKHASQQRYRHKEI